MVEVELFLVEVELFLIEVELSGSMRIIYRFHEWLIFVRVIALFMFV